MRPAVPSCLATVARDTENPVQSASGFDADRIVIQDRAAARRWLVRVIAARAVALYRERAIRSNPGDSDGGKDDGDGTPTACDQRARRIGERR